MTAQASSSTILDGNIAPDTVLAQVRNRIGHLTLNRPSGLNALNLEMVRSLQQHLDAWAKDPHVAAVVMRGAGEKAFCAGGDIRSLYDSYKNNDTLHTAFFEEEYALDLTLHHYAKPVLAVMDGYVLGGGMGLAQGADFRLVTERSRLAMPEVAIGYFPDVGASHFLSKIPGQVGTYLGVSGVQIDARDALYCGLADWYTDSTRLSELDKQLDALTWQQSPRQELEALLASIAVNSLPDAPLATLRPLIDDIFSHDSVTTIVTRLQEVATSEHRQWATDTANLLQTRSPLGMAVTLEMLRRSRALNLNLEQCFALELHLDRQWFDRGDLIEGVRALIIDKDKNPHWNPPTLNELDPAQVASFFTHFTPSGV